MRLFFLLIFTILVSFKSYTNDFQEAKDTIELRQAGMQGIWARIKRLAPFIDVDNNLDYNQELALQDAKDIKLLLERSRDLWHRKNEC